MAHKLPGRATLILQLKFFLKNNLKKEKHQTHESEKTQRRLGITQYGWAAGMMQLSRNLFRGISHHTKYGDKEKTSPQMPLKHVGTRGTKELESLSQARGHRPLSSRETRSSGVQDELQMFKHTRWGKKRERDPNMIRGLPISAG